MYTFVVLATLVCAANAGLIAGGASYASGPALGAPLVGSVTYNAPEVSVVKQPITIDQPEIRYRSVPTLVQPAPVAVPVAQTVVAAPAVARTVVAAPALTHAVPAPALSYAAAPAIAYNAGLGYAAAPAFTAYNAGYGYAAAPGLIL